MSHHVCPPWLAFILDNRLRRAIQNPGRILGRFLHPGDRAVDVGCGPGFFSVPMARQVGETGSVVAVDIDEKMLAKVLRRADRAGMSGRVVILRAGPDRLGIGVDEFDFALAFWMAHEVRAPGPFFDDIRKALKPGGSFLLVEPKRHVAEAEFAGLVAAAEAAGFRKRGPVRIRLSRAVVFGPDRGAHS
jgi:ubiquinone/menaquinone biosynthesis C-methylase UbiE